tara:strand:- start:2208 stop:3704 length:1497 start_codon:yes stop_codon:yes gene_type:complete
MLSYLTNIFKYSKQTFYFSRLLTTIGLNSIYNKICKKNSKSLMKVLKNDIKRNGAIVIKFTQWFSDRAELLYPEGEVDLTIFNDFYEQCPEHSFEITKEIFKKEFGKDIDEIIDIDKKVIASGSIGQVYKGRLKSNNKEVAVKVLHPDIDIQTFIPIFFLNLYSFFIKKLKFLRKYTFQIDFTGFIEILKQQTDFNIEAKNFNKFRENFEGNDYIIFPEVILNSKKILIMSYEEGIYYENIEETDYTKYKIATLFSLFIRQSAVINNFMHGDLHKGNWKVRKHPDKEKEYQMIVYDSGICFSMDKIKTVKDFVIAWESTNTQTTVETVFKYLHCHSYSEKELTNIKNKIASALLQSDYKPFDMSKIVKVVLNEMYKYDIVVSSELINMLVLLFVTEKVFRRNGLMGDKEEDKVKCKDSIFKVDYLNYINYCETKKCFPELCEYLKDVLKERNIKFDSMFHNLEYKLNLNSEIKDQFSEIDMESSSSESEDEKEEIPIK